ncbi:sensor histidine kinase [Mycolicibacterium mucogenicum]|uniref:ATP-binding protein n=1 Tax=Mycolicibacterium mucogenicum DSM 44124 TaxID=1226753 RepID=A0A8H2JBL4_MYCMU|nr:ATP-binding protein [Mycolicibacterium mucogenicum]KAB7754054.1 histidine kinase [Mycolicibacterium mucogenicum DSM 44124]QPG70832.1 ATP-binding protein [Mycolicibacterium mucogenicum DSM 44124]
MFDTGTGAARRNFLAHTMLISLFMRHGGALVVYAVVLVSAPRISLAGVAFAGLAGAWSLYRLLTRSATPRIIAIDYAVTIAACLVLPLAAADDQVCPPTCAPIAIGGTAIASFTVFEPLLNAAMAAGVVAAVAAGAAPVGGVHDTDQWVNVYYFALLWVASTLIRILTVRVAEKVDAARAERLAVELRQKVNAAVRDYDREQTRLLHDTVASTLLMVGTGAALSPERVAAQARRDLRVFTETSHAPAPPADLVAALRDHAAHTTTPVSYAGVSAMWVDGATAAPIAAAAREALTNVDRHSGAAAVTITVQLGRIQITDDGRGFDPTRPTRGHGIADSIIARMQQLGGVAEIITQPGQGTTVELCWPTAIPANAGPAPDPERLIERAHMGYGLALVAYGLANLLVTVPASLRFAAYPYLQWTLIVVTTAAALSAIPRVMGRTYPRARFGIMALVIVALVQSISMPINDLDPRWQWAEGAIGWCVLPLLLSVRLSYAVGVLVWCWVVPAIYAIIRNPSVHTVVDLGYDTASVLVAQLCALVVADMIRRSAAAASAETESHMRLTAAAHIADAVQEEYDRRYADLAATIQPLLCTLADGKPVDAETRRRAQLEYQRLRTLFDQSASFEHVLLRELRPRIDAAQNRGLAISVDVQGTLPAMDVPTARRLARLVDQVLQAAASPARITVTAESAAVELSVMCQRAQHADLPTKSSVDDEDEFDLTTLDDTVWITVRHPLPERSTEHVRAGQPI